jgi:hypothetical protein
MNRNLFVGIVAALLSIGVMAGKDLTPRVDAIQTNDQAQDRRIQEVEQIRR